MLPKPNCGLLFQVDLLKAELEQLVEEADESNPGLDAYIRFESTQSGYRISPKRPLVKKLKEVYKKLSLPGSHRISGATRMATCSGLLASTHNTGDRPTGNYSRL
jgi:hypothetical protein